jgi:parallel beta-helix repeat protein
MLKLSRFFRRFLAPLLVVSLVVPSPAFASTHQASLATYYVSSSTGNDANDGLSEGTAFATVGKVNALNLQPGDSVLFKCGDTWRGQMLTITKSGAAGSPITIGSYPSNCANRPVLSGAQPVSGWALHSGNIYVASLNAGANAGKFAYGINQLFRGDTRLLLGRWPNLDAADGGYSTIESQPGGNQIRDDQLPGVNWAGAVAHIKGMRWYILNRQVTGSSGTTLTFGANNDCWAGNCTGWGYFLNNHISTLDRDGEWYYDATTQKVYIYTTTGAPANGQIEGSVILKNDDRSWGGVTIGEDLVGQGPSYITVENLDVRRWFRSGIAIPTNFAHYEPHHLVIQNNTISDVDMMGIDLATWVYDAWDGRPDGWRGGYDLTVSGNTITRANSMGINLYSRNSTFSGNTIQEVGLIENLGAAGIGCSFNAGGGSCTEDGDGIRIKIDQSEDTGHTNLITGNRLERIAYNGMDVFGHHNTIEKNVIIQACYAKGDCGGVRTFGRDNLASSPVHDLIFNANIILDIIGNTDGCKSDFDALFGFGLYIDHYSHNVVVTGNTIINSTVHGILFQDSTGSVTNNTLYNNGRTYPYSGGQVYLGGAPAALSAHTGNILYSLNPNAWTLALANPANLGTSNNNHFFSPYKVNHISASGAKSLATWRTFSGKDETSKEHWFTLGPTDPPNSQIFYNDTNLVKTINLGNAVYKDLDQNYVWGDLILQPYQSKVLVAFDGTNLDPFVLSSARADTNPTNLDSVNFIVTFSEPVMGVDIADFTLATVGISGASLTSLSGSSSIYTITASTGSGFGSLRLDIPGTASITDLMNNPVGGLPYTAGEVYTISWIGSASIASDQNVVAVARPHLGSEVASYIGSTAGSTTQYVPMLFKGAFSGGTYNAALYIQNVSASAATLSLEFTDSSGAVVYTKADTLDPHASKGYWLPAETGLPNGFAGGVKVTSTQPILAVGRPHINGQVMTYNGMSSGATTAWLPMFFKNGFGSYNTALYVQNLTASSANLTIDYINLDGTVACTDNDTLDANASKGYWSLSIACDTGSLPGGFVGGVKVTSTQNILAVGRAHLGTQITTYNGFPGGATSAYLPMLFRKAFGGTYNAALYLQNVSGSSADVVIEYLNSAGTVVATQNVTLAANAISSIWLPGVVGLADGFAGGARISSTQNVIAVGRPHLGNEITTYNGAPAGSLNAYLPMLFKDAYGGSYDAAFYVQNTSGSAANVEISFYYSAGVLSCIKSIDLAAGAIEGFWMPTVTCEP